MGHEYYWASTQTKVTGFRLTYSLQLNAVKSFYIFPLSKLTMRNSLGKGWQERCLVLMIVFIPLPSAGLQGGKNVFKVQLKLCHVSSPDSPQLFATIPTPLGQVQN